MVRLFLGTRALKKLPAELSAATPRRVVKNERSSNLSMGSLEHKQVKKSRQKNSPDTCPLAEAGRETVGIYDVRCTIYDLVESLNSPFHKQRACGQHVYYYCTHFSSCRLLQNR